MDGNKKIPICRVLSSLLLQISTCQDGSDTTVLRILKVSGINLRKLKRTIDATQSTKSSTSKKTVSAIVTHDHGSVNKCVVAFENYNLVGNHTNVFMGKFR